MTMLIQKFHKLIQSKLLWIGFLIIVIFSFVIWGTYTPQQNDRAQEALAAGWLDGEPVPQDEYNYNRFHAYLALSLSSLRPPQMTDELRDLLEDQAWKRLVTLRKAKEMGVTTTNEEVVNRIKQDPLFAAEGRFSQVRYNLFRQNFLAGSLGISERQFEDHIREELVRAKMMQMVSTAAVIPPHELKRRFHMLQDAFVIEHATLPFDQVEKDVEVTDEAAKAFFTENPQPFETPEQVKVRYVAFPVEAFLDEVEEVDEEKVRAYYDANLEDFTSIPEPEEPEVVEETATESEESITVDADGDATVEATETDETVTVDAEDDTAEADAVAETEEPDVVAEPVTKPYEEAKDEILDLLRRQQASYLAAEAATDFVVTLAPDRAGEAPGFEETTAKFGREILTLPAFTAFEPIEGVDAGNAFNRAAFGLEDDPEAYFSDAVMGKDNVYVLVLDERIAPHIPGFEEVREEVLEAAKANALTQAMTEKAAEIRASAEQAVSEGKTFTEALLAYDLEPERTESFTAVTGLEDLQLPQILLRGVLTRNAGEVVEPVPSPDGVILAYVVSRDEPDPTAFTTAKGQIEGTLRRRQGALLYQDWEEYILRDAKLEKREAPPPETGGEEELDETEG